MTRTKRGSIARRRRKKILQLAMGYRGASSRIFKLASQRVTKALYFASKSRFFRKRIVRALWIARVNACVRMLDSNYNQATCDLKQSESNVNRKSLSQMATLDPRALSFLADIFPNDSP